MIVVPGLLFPVPQRWLRGRPRQSGMTPGSPHQQNRHGHSRRSQNNPDGGTDVRLRRHPRHGHWHFSPARPREWSVLPELHPPLPWATSGREGERSALLNLAS